MPHAKLAFIHGNIVFGIFQQSGARAKVLRLFGLSGHIAILRGPTHGPPRLAAAIAVYGSLARDGHIFHLVGIDTGRIVPASQSLPRGFHQWIELGIEGKPEGCAFFHHKVHAAEQAYGAGLPYSCRYHHASATALGALGDGPVNGFLVLCRGGLGRGPEPGDGILLVGKLRHANALFDLFVHGIVPRPGHSQQRQKQRCQQCR